VLLIIFMVTARIIVSQGMRWICPKRQRRSAANGVLGRAHGRRQNTRRLRGHSRRRRHRALAKKAKAKTKDLRAVIRADKKVEHGRVIHVLDLLRRSGIAKIAFAVTPALKRFQRPRLSQK